MDSRNCSSSADKSLHDANHHRHGRLKIFLGLGPGVGKTHAMLRAAYEAQHSGHQVAIGAINSHGLIETERLCECLARVPIQAGHGEIRAATDLDVDAAVAHQPHIILVDDAAHRNNPGARHPFRYQDIEDLLGEGIDVWTTLSIQHLESLNDRVARISGVRIRNTVPDELFENAEDVVLVDLAPGELIDRLKQGKVFIPTSIGSATDSFFSISSLTALRQLTFVAATNRVDADLRRASQRHNHASPLPARERVVIAIDGHHNAHQAVRTGKRIAARRGAPWTAVYVNTGKPHTSSRRLSIDRAFQLAERLGGQTAVLRGSHVEDEVLVYARDQNASSIVIAQTHGRPFVGWFRQTLTQRLLRRNTDFEITVVGSRKRRPFLLRRYDPARLASGQKIPARHYLFAALVIALAVFVSALLDYLLPLPVANFSLIFLAGVLLIATRTSLPVALATAGISSFAFNFFFIEPRYNLSMYHTGEVITVVFFLVVAVIGGNLANRLRTQVAALRATNEQSQALLALSKQLAGTPEPNAVQNIAVQSIAAFAGSPVCLMTIKDATDELCLAAFSTPELLTLTGKEKAAAVWTFKQCRASGYRTNTFGEAKWRFLPLALEDTCYGVLGVQLATLPTPPRNEQLLMLDALSTQVTLTLARTQLATSLQQARVAEETERLRSALLSSVSHDLRTPLSSMIGSASTLRELAPQLAESDRRELLDVVLSEGRRLDRYIDNLLDMTRLGHGTLSPDCDWVTLADIVSAALRRLRGILSTIQVTRDIPVDLPLLYVQPILIECIFRPNVNTDSGGT